MYILTSGHASLHAKLMAKCTAHEEGFPHHSPLALVPSGCVVWLQFNFGSYHCVTPTHPYASFKFFSSYSCGGREPPTRVNVS